MAEGPYEYQAKFVPTRMVDTFPSTVVGAANARAREGYRLIKVELIAGDKGREGLFLLFERHGTAE